MLELDEMVFILTSSVRLGSACSSAAVYERMDIQRLVHSEHISVKAV